MDINCIIKNTVILEQLKKIVAGISITKIANNEVPTPSNIYNTLRENGIEIDLSTVGAIYINELSSTEPHLSIAEVENEIGADFNRFINSIISNKPALKKNR